MGTVYRAWDSSGKRHVALKVLPPYFIHDELFVKRFRRESQAVASLHHPHIVQLYEAGEHHDTLFMAMQLVHGGTLKELLQEHAPLDPERCLPIIEQIAQALDYAHQEGFVHRDVKPTNILLTREGEAILTDFGIAKATAGTSLTKTGFGMGTPEYMSPEQSQGKDVDSRSDVYSLGIILYEMLTGQVPFTAETPLVVLHHHVYETPAPPREINRDLSRQAEQVVLKALAKKPEQRYATARALAEAFRMAVLEVEGETATIAHIPGLEDATATVAVRVGVDEQAADPLYSQALAAFDDQRWQEAIELFTQVLAIAGDYRDTFVRLTEASKQRRLETLLADAQQAMEDEQWTGAIDLSVEILSLEPSHKDADTLLRHARRAQSLKNLYAQAEEELGKGALPSAIAYLERVLELAPDYRDGQLLLEQAREELAEQLRIADFYAQGKDSLQKEDWESAIKSLHTVLSLDPEHEEASQLLAQAEEGLARAKEVESLYQRGFEHLSEEKWSEAIKVLRQLLETEPAYRDAEELLTQAETGLQLATLYANAAAASLRSEQQEAIENLKELLAIDPHYEDASQLLARLEQDLLGEQDEKERLERIADLYALSKECLEAENWEVVIETLQQVLQIDPKHEKASALLAQAQDAQARAQEVSSLYEQALSSSREKSWADVITALTQLLELEPEHEEATQLLAQAQQELNKEQLEKARLERLEEVYQQAEESLRDERWSEAVERLQEIVSSEPQYREAAVLLAQAQRALETQERLEALYQGGAEALEAEDWPAAIAKFQQILQIDPEHEEVSALLAQGQDALSRQEEVASLYEQATTGCREHNWAEVVTVLTRLLELEPEHEEATELLAQAQGALETRERLEVLYGEGIETLEAEDWERAIDKFQQILATKPDYQDIGERLKEARKGHNLANMYAEAQTLLEEQEWAKAAERLEKLLADQPDYKDTQQLLATAQAALAALPETAIPTERVTGEPTVEVPTEVIPRRRSFTLGIVGTVLTGLVVIVGGYFVLSRRIPEDVTTGESSVPSSASPSAGGIIAIAQGTTASPVPQYEAEEIMALAEEAMADVNSFHFELESSGTMVYLEDGEPATFSRAKGDIVRPDSLDMQATVSVKGLPMTIRIIAVDQVRLMSHLLSQGWVDVPLNLDISPLFGDEGIVDRLWAIQDITLFGVEEIEGEARYHLSVSPEGMNSYLHTIGIATEGEVEIWVDSASFHLRRVHIAGLGAEGEEIEWLMDLSAFDELVAIQLPTPTPTPAAPMALIPAGEFIMGSSDTDTMADDDEKPQRTVYLDSFYIDVYEVTNARYRECVQADACEPPQESSSGNRESYHRNPLYDDYPVIYVSWYEAEAYCEWVGKRFPTEAEWEKAARGADGRIYAWGDEWDDSKANCDWSVGDTTAVGTYLSGASPYGVQDMAGNVAEWVADWYDPNYYQTAPDRNPSGPSLAIHRVHRGGAWSSISRGLRTASRSPASGGRADFNLGFRCAQSLQPRGASTPTTIANPAGPITPTPTRTSTPTPRIPTPTPTATPDTTPPQILRTSPADGETGVSRDLESITITFTEPIQHRWSVSYRNFPTCGGESCAEIVHDRGSDTFVIRITWGGECGDRFPPGQTVTLITNPQNHELWFRDPAGNLAPTQSFCFTTADQ